MRGLQGLAKFWFDVRIYLLTPVSVERNTPLLTIARFYKVDMDALDGHDWFPYFYSAETVIDIRELTTMNRCLPAGSRKWNGSCTVEAVYVDTFANRGMNLQIVKAALD